MFPYSPKAFPYLSPGPLKHPHSGRSGFGPVVQRRGEWDGVGVVQTLCFSSCWVKVTHCCEIKTGARWSTGGGQLSINVNYNGQ